jgi:hypothetical protein
MAATLGATLVALLGGPPPASASEASRILERCAHGESLAGFSPAAYAQALRSVPTVLSEYSNCEELIRKAELAAAGGPGAGGPGAGAFGASSSAIAPPTPLEQATLARARTEGAAPVGLGNATVDPGVVNVGIASAFSTLPDSLIALLALFLAAALTAAARAAAARSGRRPADGFRALRLPARRE